MPALIAPVAAAVVSGGIGAANSAADRDAANAARQQALQQWLKLNVPDPAQQAIELQRYMQTGSFSPTLQKTFAQSPTGLATLNVDPSTRAAQMQALAKLQELSHGGNDAETQAADQVAEMRAGSAAKGSRDAIVANMAARGMGGASGAGLQAQLTASQADQNSLAMQETQAASAAQQRALQALSSGATLAGQVRGADYSQAAEAAKAQDAINQFNARNSQQVEGSNAAAQTTAQAQNTNLTQQTANANTGIANEQEKYNKGLIQQRFENEAKKTAGETGQYDAVAKQDTANADRTADRWAGIGDALAQGIGAYAQSQNSKKASTDDDEE